MRKINYTVMVGTKISEKTAKNLNKIAEAKNWTVSQTIRIILEDYLK